MNLGLESRSSPLRLLLLLEWVLFGVAAISQIVVVSVNPEVDPWLDILGMLVFGAMRAIFPQRWIAKLLYTIAEFGLLLQEVKQLGTQALQDVRESVGILRTDPLQGRSIASSIERLITEFQRATGLTPSYRIELVGVAARNENRPLPTDWRANSQLKPPQGGGVTFKLFFPCQGIGNREYYRSMIRLLLVDDQNLIRRGLRALLKTDAELEIVGEAENGREAIDLIAALQPDVVLMDIRMPIVDGVEATRIICARSPAPKVLVLTTFDDREYVTQALQAGAAGYLLKDTPFEELTQAIRLVKGYTQLGPGLARKLLVQPAPPSTLTVADAWHELTPREQ